MTNMDKTENSGNNLNTKNVFVLTNAADGFNTKKHENLEDEKPVDFETAITATGFGKFNIFLIIMAIPSGWSSIFETTTMSYVFPAAQCDLSLTLEDKGFLNAITYIGMISSAFVWGFLCDTLGRKKLLAIGLFLDAVFVIMSATSQNVMLLMISKFMGGFIINGPFAALTAYLSEFHSAQYRARVQMMLGIVFSSGTVILPLIAWTILPLNINLKPFNDTVVFHSWHLYLVITALPALIGSVAFAFMPESPKFLMTVGKNEKALQVFRNVYSYNTGKQPETFAITKLIDETKLDKPGGNISCNRSKVQALKEGWRQIKPLFLPPYLLKIILVCSLQCFFMMSLNTLRLWLPQIFQAINDYQYFNNGTSASLCTMLSVIRPSKPSINNNVTEECVVITDNDLVYKNSMIVASVTICGYICAGMVINKFGKKRMMNFLSLVSGLSAMSIYFAVDSLTTTILTSLFISLGSITVNCVLAVVVDLFPTTLRTMTVSLTMMIGRSGAMMGNLVFPLLLQMGCAPPFFAVGSVMIGCALLSCLLPDTENKSLE